MEREVYFKRNSHKVRQETQKLMFKKCLMTNIHKTQNSVKNLHVLQEESFSRH